MYKKLTIVDENDVVIGAAEYEEAYAKNLIKRCSRVFVFDTNGRQLLQKRSAQVQHPHLLDQAAGGHVDEGESYYEAAVREMKEELGLSGFELTEAAEPHRFEAAFSGIFKAVVPVDTEVHYDPTEVESICWLSIEELEQMIDSNPELFTAGYVAVWRDLRDRLIA